MSSATASDAEPKILSKVTVGSLKLNHRIVLAPLTRLRAESNTLTVTPLHAQYYSQRYAILRHTGHRIPRCHPGFLNLITFLPPPLPTPSSPSPRLSSAARRKAAC